ncbi:hypothetical protein MOV08_21165 [Streptomyces yunnanensis]|uniref:Holliday junction resolvase RusA (Prophage-encoded endonuclease) n=1 Tax=Streptomyces yunnanensis TaxID=156453 RepID=A0ABY8ADE0_9ACTN|nr:hypothetical protein [Streptomyces yunnanensis]WEB41532.1 hypothetical protein MOV08_21165 [Streptomyces yunnanensis]
MVKATHTVELPPGMTLLNSNHRVHHYRRARIVKALRNAAKEAAAGLPALDGCGPVRIIAVLHPHDRRRRDPANWYPSVKAAVDGLVDAGVLTDDDHTRVIGPDMRLGDVVCGTQLVLHLHPLAA